MLSDLCLMYYRGKFYLYYKGERMGEGMTFGGREIAWGVAIADDVTGPYVKSEYNPVTNSVHEVCVWPYQGGLAALLTTDGPEKNTIQWSPDGINFEIMSVIKGAPEALGVFRTPDYDKGPLEGIRWACATSTVATGSASGGMRSISRGSFENLEPRIRTNLL